MGVKGFFSIRTSEGTIADLGVPVRLASLEGQRVCVEASGIIYAAMTALPPLSDAEGRPTAHIKIVFQKVIQFSEAGIHQVWILDSPVPPPLKARTCAERATRSTYRLQREHVEEVKALLTLMGVSWIQAPETVEAEQYGACLSSGREPYCSYVVSADSDVLVFGGNLLRPVMEKGKTIYYAYRLADVLERLGLTLDQLRTLAVAMGTDYNKKTPRVGPATILQRVKNGTIALTDEQKVAKEFYALDITCRLDEVPRVSQLDRKGVLDYLVSRGFKREPAEKQLARMRA